MSLVSFIGPKPNLLGINEINPPYRLEISQPVLSYADMAKLRNIAAYTDDKFHSAELDICYPLAWGKEGVEARLASLCAEAQDAVQRGCGLLIVSDRKLDRDHVAIPALLATSAVHQHLVTHGLRTRAGLVVETGSARETHHFAVLAGYGAEAVHPYLALETLQQIAGSDAQAREKAVKHYIKGSHAAIKTGMLAAEAAYEAITGGRQHDELTAYPKAFEASWLHTELNKARNFKAWFKKGLTVATVMNGIEQFALKGHIPWTLHRDKPDHAYLKPAAECKPIVYPKPDGKITFDRLSSVFVSNTNHAENQPAHLTLKDASVPVNINLAKYAGPESRYCPAGVYEFVPDTAKGGDAQRLQINAQNCVHCKTCDIKDPTQNIVWVTPEGGGGPNYSGM